MSVSWPIDRIVSGPERQNWPLKQPEPLAEGAVSQGSLALQADSASVSGCGIQVMTLLTRQMRKGRSASGLFRLRLFEWDAGVQTDKDLSTLSSHCCQGANRLSHNNRAMPHSRTSRFVLCASAPCYNDLEAHAAIAAMAHPLELWGASGGRSDW